LAVAGGPCVKVKTGLSIELSDASAEYRVLKSPFAGGNRTEHIVAGGPCLEHRGLVIPVFRRTLQRTQGLESAVAGGPCRVHSVLELAVGREP
jgi:hypothetical protein